MVVVVHNGRGLTFSFQLNKNALRLVSHRFEMEVIRKIIFLARLTMIAPKPRVPCRPRHTNKFSCRRRNDTSFCAFTDFMDTIFVRSSTTPTPLDMSIREAFRQLDDLAITFERREHIRLLSVQRLRMLSQLFLSKARHEHTFGTCYSVIAIAVAPLGIGFQVVTAEPSHVFLTVMIPLAV